MVKNMYQGWGGQQQTSIGYRGWGVKTTEEDVKTYTMERERKRQEEEERRRKEQEKQAEEQSKIDELAKLAVEEKQLTWQQKAKQAVGGAIQKVGGFIKEKYEQEKAKPVLQRMKELPTGGDIGKKLYQTYKEKSQAPLATLLRTGSLKETGESTLAAAKRSISPFDEEGKLTNIMGVGMVSGGLKNVAKKPIRKLTETAVSKTSPLIQEARKEATPIIEKIENKWIGGITSEAEREKEIQMALGKVAKKYGITKEILDKEVRWLPKKFPSEKPSVPISPEGKFAEVDKFIKGGIKPAETAVKESPLIQEARKTKLYHGTDSGSASLIDEEGLRYGDFLTENKQEALDYAKMRTKQRGGKPVVREFNLGKNEVYYNAGTNEWQYRGGIEKFKGKYPQNFYKEYNDYFGSNMTAKEIDAQTDVWDVAKALSGYNEIKAKKLLGKSQPLQEGGVKAIKPTETAVSKTILAKKPEISGQKATLPIGQTAPTQVGGIGEGGGLSGIPKSASYKDSDLVSILTKELKKVKPLRGEQEVLYTKARGEKMAKMMVARRKMAGEKGFFAEKGALAGELPKIQYEPIRQKFSQENVDQLFNMIKKSEAIDEWDKVAAQEGLVKMLGEKGFGLPTRNEIEKMHQIFGKDFTEALLSKRPYLERFKEAGLQAYNLPRTLMAGVGDFSATLMQNLVFAYRHPVITAKNFTRSLKYFANDDYYRASMQEIYQRPNQNFYKEAKLSFTDVSPIVSQREEQFMASWAEKIPGLGRIIKATGRSYTGFLNRMRADVADTIIDVQKQVGNKIDDPKFLKYMGTLVNAGTGRGSLGALEKSGSILAQGFFSARKMVATFNLINPVFYIKAPPVVRKEALKTMFAFFAGASTITGLAKLAGAEVSTDPTNADFMKIKVGNTRINLFGPYQQLSVLVARQLLGYQTSSTTGRRVYLGEGYKPLNRLQLFGRWLESKEHPTLSYIAEAMKGEDEVGRKFQYGPEVLDRFMPMIISDSYDLYKEHGAKGLWGVIPTMLGLPTQTYGKQVPIMEKTETGEEKLKLRGIPGLGEDIYNKLTGKQVSGIPKEEQQAIVEKEQAKSQYDYEHQEKMKEAKKRVFETGKYERVDDTFVYKEGNELKTTTSENTIQAKELWSQWKDLSDSDRSKAVTDWKKTIGKEKGEPILTQVKKEKKNDLARQNGLDTESDWMSMDLEDRADYLVEKTKDMPNDDRLKFLNKLWGQELISEELKKLYITKFKSL